MCRSYLKMSKQPNKQKCVTVSLWVISQFDKVLCVWNKKKHPSKTNTLEDSDMSDSAPPFDSKMQITSSLQGSAEGRFTVTCAYLWTLNCTCTIHAHAHTICVHVLNKMGFISYLIKNLGKALQRSAYIKILERTYHSSQSSPVMQHFLSQACSHRAEGDLCSLRQILKFSGLNLLVIGLGQFGWQRSGSHNSSSR